MKQHRTARRFLGWHMVGLAFLAYNSGLTMVITAFGPALPALQRDFAASRSDVAMAFGVFMLSIGLLAPVFGNLTRWLSLRTLMMAGCIVNAAGFGLLAHAQNLVQLWILYGVVIGAGTCMMSIVAAPSLISRWFEHDRGKALGFGLVQVFGLVVAPAAAWLVGQGGRQLLFFVLAGCFAALVPVFAMVKDRPEKVGQAAHGAGRTDDAIAAAAASLPILTTRQLFADRRFWLLAVTIGFFSMCGIVFSAHGPAMAAAKGASLSLGALALSAAGIGALVGTIGFGWLADRIGSFRALILCLLFCGSVWALFSVVSAPLGIVFLGLLVGCSTGPAATLHAACLNDLYGAASISRAIGYSYFLKIPFLFAGAPLAGHLFDISGNYGSTYLLLLAGSAIAATLAFILMLTTKRPRYRHH